MLLAEKKYDLSLEQEFILEQEKPKVKIKRISRKSKFSFIVLVFICFAIALLFLSRVILVTSKGYELVSLEKEINLLQTDNQRLKYEIEELSSLKNIEKRALNKLKMVKPAVNDCLFIPKKENIKSFTNETIDKNTITKEKETKETNDKQVFNKILNIFSY